LDAAVLTGYRDVCVNLVETSDEDGDRKTFACPYVESVASSAPITYFALAEKP
jgi:hypothetical protein